MSCSERNHPLFLDLRGVSCPLNYAKAKLALEKMGAGDVLKIELDRGNPAEYVPRTLESDGHEILDVGGFRENLPLTGKEKV